jgi:rubredoxin
MQNIIPVAVGILVLVFLVLAMRCPECKRYGKEMIDKETLEEGGIFKPNRTLITYRCKHCGHVWNEQGSDDPMPRT